MYCIIILVLIPVIYLGTEHGGGFRVHDAVVRVWFTCVCERVTGTPYSSTYHKITYMYYVCMYTFFLILSKYESMTGRIFIYMVVVPGYPVLGYIILCRNVYYYGYAGILVSIQERT